MTVFKTKKRVAVPADIAYAVASDVAQYKAFLPLLEQSTIRGAVSEQGGVSQFQAELIVGYAKMNLRESFVSQVSCDANARAVTATSKEAPFKNMKTVWSIREVNGDSDVSISIDYSMRNVMLQMVLGGMMEMAVNKVMAAFEARAIAVHKQSQTS